MFDLTKYIEHRNSNDDLVITAVEPLDYDNTICNSICRADAMVSIALGHIMIEETGIGFAFDGVRSVECSMILPVPMWRK